MQPTGVVGLGPRTDPGDLDKAGFSEVVEVRAQNPAHNSLKTYLFEE